MVFPQNFIIASTFTQKWEKGYINHPKDPGGATYNGISLRFLKQTGTDINGDGVINAKDIETLYRNKDQAKVDEIFFKAFWRDPILDNFIALPVQVALYDSNVNTGRTQTAKFLQRACNDVGAGLVPLADDGIIGPKTLARVARLVEEGDGLILACAICERRKNFHNLLANNSPYADGRDYRPFLKGWLNRVNDLLRYLGGLI